MKYWKFIDVGDYNLIADKVLRYSLRKVNLKTCPFWNPLPLNELEVAVPELFEGVAKLQNKIKEAALLVLKADTSTIHIDHTVELNAGVQARVNLPILNTAESETAFFVMTEKHERFAQVHPKNGSKSWGSGVLRSLFTPVDSVSVVQPTILRTSEPHTVFCHSKKFPRLTLTISFEQDAVVWLDDDSWPK